MGELGEAGEYAEGLVGETVDASEEVQLNLQSVSSPRLLYLGYRRRRCISGQERERMLLASQCLHPLRRYNSDPPSNRRRQGSCRRMMRNDGRLGDGGGFGGIKRIDPKYSWA